MTGKIPRDKRVAKMGEDLRHNAEALLNSAPEKFALLSSQDQEVLLHELRVHEIELEMQNAQLQQAYLELETAHDHYEDLYNFAPVGYMTVGEKGIIQEVNLTMARMLGIDRKLLLLQYLNRFLVEQAQDSFYLNLRYILRAGKSLGFDTRMKRNDGAQFDAHFDMAIQQIGAESAVRIAVSDISERKEAEARFQLAVESSPNAIILVDQQGRIAMLNSQTEKSFGYDRAELLGITIEKLVPKRLGGEHVRHRGSFYASPQIRQMGERRELFARRKDGSEFPVDISLMPIETRAGPLIMARITDITERKQAEAELRESNERLHELTNRLSEVEETERRSLARELHDRVGQTLTALNINLNIIKSQLPYDSAEASVDRIDDSIQLVEEIVARVRDVMADLNPPVLADYGLAAALHAYADLFAWRSEIPIRVEESGKTESRLASHIEAILFRVAQEALTNVARHAEAKHVTVKLNVAANTTKLIIQDDGRGFDSLAVNPTGESGWGLRILQERVEAVGGTFNVASRSGHGAKLTVELPNAKPGNREAGP